MKIMKANGFYFRIIFSFALFLFSLGIFSIFGHSFGFDIFTKKVYAESVNVNLLVAVCNSNLICEDVIGENYGSCPSDCEAPPPPPTPTTTSSSTPTTGPGGGFTNPPNGTGNNSGSSTNNFPLNPNLPNNNSQNGANNNNNSGNNSGSIIKPPGTIPQSGIDGIIKIAPYTTSATLNFKTYLASLLSISWGKTATYELGSMADSWYHQNFSKEITELEPGTRYYYRIELLDSLGRRNQYEGEFMTSSEKSTAPLPVALNFEISTKRQSDLAILTWNIRPAKETILSDLVKEEQRRLNQNISLREELDAVQADKNSGIGSDNTSDSDSEDDNDKLRADSASALKAKLEDVFVRLTRSEFKFPQDPFEGKVIYEGRGEQATDIDLRDGKEYYYSIFIMNGKGEYSSPAIIKYIHKNDLEYKNTKEKTQIDPLIKDSKQVDIEKWLNSETKTGFCGQSNAVQPTLSLKDTFSGASKSEKEGISIQFMKNGQALEPSLGVINTDGREKLIIRVAGDRFEVGDRVGICLFSKADLTYTDYLLTKNADGTFELIFPAISSIFSGKSDYQFTLGMIKYNGAEMVLERGEISFFIPSKKYVFSLIDLLFLIIILIGILWIGKRYRLVAIFNR